MNTKQTNKTINEYISEFGRLLNAVTESRQKLCENYAGAVEAFGKDEAEKAYSEAYPPIAPLLPYILLVGQGKAHVGVTSLGFEEMRRQASKLDPETQKSLFEDGAIVRDPRTGEQKHVMPSDMSKSEWETLCDAKNHKLRNDDEQNEFLVAKKRHNKAVERRRKHKEPWVFEDGKVRFLRPVDVTVFKLVEIVLRCVLKFPELKINEFIHVDLKKFQAAKKACKK